jgi:hypothetical protein
VGDVAFIGEHFVRGAGRGKNTTNNLFPTLFTGKVLRIHENGDVEEIASGLFLPTAMTFGRTEICKMLGSDRLRSV